MKKYIEPSINVKEINVEAGIMANSIDAAGLDDAPEYDETYEGTVGSKKLSIWDTDEDKL